MELITSTDVVRNLCKKMAPPLVTLLSAEPEIQYVALRNINLIVQRRPGILAHEIKVHWKNAVKSLFISTPESKIDLIDVVYG
jgi:vesicle coat complex subunit